MIINCRREKGYVLQGLAIKNSIGSGVEKRQEKKKGLNFEKRQKKTRVLGEVR
jgi:hypothetical protein